LGILNVIADRSSGFDMVSGGDHYRVLQAGDSPQKTVYACVGKTHEEIQAGLKAGGLMFNVESEAELKAIVRMAASIDKIAPIALRVIPNVDSEIYRYISTGKKESKFGMDVRRAERAAEAAATIASSRMIDMHMQIGLQITTTQSYADAVAKGVKLISRLRRLGHQLLIKSGRVISGNAGILVSHVVDTKQSAEKRFLFQDAAMNDLIQRALYESFHWIWPVVITVGISPPPDDAKTTLVGIEPWDVVGPVCGFDDFFATDQLLPQLDRELLLAIISVGAYGMVTAFNYNTRLRALEIFVDGSYARLIRRRETYEDLLRQEVELA
jgi:diaminopimelate decarboxylase